MKLQIETSSKCQCRCIFCYRTVENIQGGEIIDNTLFNEIIRQADSMFNITGIALTGLGEPLLDFNLPNRIERVRKTFPKATISVYTNGILLTEKRIDELGKCGLNEIYISLNAATSEFHQQVMGVENRFDQIVNMIEYALNVSGLKTYIPVIVSSEYIEKSQVELLKERWSPNSLFLHYVANWAGKLYKLRYRPLDNYCRWHDQEIYVNVKGQMCLCCFDPMGDYAFGNVKDSSLYEIYWGEKRQNFIKEIEEKGRANVKPCADCTTI